MIFVIVVVVYIILGILFIGCEIENFFGQDVNDLFFEVYVVQVVVEMDVIVSCFVCFSYEWIEFKDNYVLWFLFYLGWFVWMNCFEEKIYEVVNYKVLVIFYSK